jgi:glyoxylase-like metal-dependent hydrolase (beta-lactamase superfamily II)
MLKLHVDHASNVVRFNRARFHIQEREAAFVTGPCMCEPFIRALFDVEDVVTLIRRLYEDRVVFHRDASTIHPGISVHLLPGHSAGMQAVRVNTPRGPVVLASDVIHFYANLIERRPFRITLDTAATLRSYSGLLSLAGSIERIVPGHDPMVGQIYPGLSINGVALSSLHEPPSCAPEAP